MKTCLSIILVGLLLFCSTIIWAARGTINPVDELAGSSKVKIVSAPELESLTSAWISSYQQLNADQEFVVGCEAEKATEGYIHFFTSNHPFAGNDELTGKIVVGHEIIVTVINAGNPLNERLLGEGIIASDLLNLLTAGHEAKFIKPDATNAPLNVYLTGDEQLESKLAAYCQTDESFIVANKASSAGSLLSSVQQDVNAIGFCRLADVLNPEKNEFAKGITIVPIDKNRNGKIDGFENIYSSPEELTRGAWIGKYPRMLCGEVFAASTSLPMNEASADFLAWVINEGQEPLTALGFSKLSARERAAGMLAVRPVSPSGNSGSAPVSPNMWMMAAAAGAFILILVMAIRGRLKRKLRIQGEDLEITPAMNIDSILAPAGLFYDKTHTWAFMEQNGLVKVGIDDFLQHITGRLTQVKMRAPGDKIRKGEKILTIIREGKQLEIYSPVTGYIKTQNKSLLSNPSQINSDPYSSGWVYQVEPSNWLRETKFMFMAVKFTEWLEEEFVRLKDFLAASANKNAVVYNHIVLQDGGELTDNVLANLEPEVWEDFQTQFLDTSR